MVKFVYVNAIELIQIYYANEVAQKQCFILYTFLLCKIASFLFGD